MVLPSHGAAAPWLLEENLPRTALRVGRTGWGSWAGLHRREEQHAVLGAAGLAAVLGGLVAWRGGSARWLQRIWLLRQLAVAARRPSGEPKTKVSEPGASLLQPSLPGCEWSELFHSDPGDSTKAFMSCPNSRWSYSGIQ